RYWGRAAASVAADPGSPHLRQDTFTASLTLSKAAPGSMMAVLAAGSTDIIRWQYLVQSIITASLQHWPARLVPPPPDRTGAPASRQTAPATAAAATLRGTPPPRGPCR